MRHLAMFWRDRARLFRLRSIAVWFRTRGPVPEEPAQPTMFTHPPDGYVYSDPTLSGTRFLYRVETKSTRDFVVIDHAPVAHVGADGDWAREVTAMVEKHEPLTEEIKRALTTDTGEFDTVALMVHQDAEERAEVEDPAMHSWVEDELGFWDPDSVDWSEPAIFREVAREALAKGELHPPIGEAEFIDAIMRRVLEPAR